MCVRFAVKAAENPLFRRAMTLGCLGQPAHVLFSPVLDAWDARACQLPLQGDTDAASALRPATGPTNDMGALLAEAQLFIATFSQVQYRKCPVLADFIPMSGPPPPTALTDPVPRAIAAVSIWPSGWRARRRYGLRMISRRSPAQGNRADRVLRGRREHRGDTASYTEAVFGKTTCRGCIVLSPSSFASWRQFKHRTGWIGAFLVPIRTFGAINFSELHDFIIFYGNNRTEDPAVRSR